MKQNRLSILFASALTALAFAGCSSAPAAAPDGSSAPAPSAPASSAAASAASEAPADTFDLTAPITVISREDGSGTRGAFIELFGVEVKADDGTKTDQTTKEATVVNSTEMVISSVVQDPFAIGYISLGSLNSSVKALRVDGAEAMAENVKNGSYPVARPFNIATKGEAAGLAGDFIGFILSREGQEVIANGYIPVDDAAAPYAGEKPAGKLVIAGSSSVSPIMEKLAEAYKAVNPDATIEMQTSDSTSGMTAALDGTCDIGMASRELKDSEKAELTPIQIALDGIAVVVNPENPKSDITSEQVRAVYTGEATLWNEVE